jgi:ParB-like chromosome segregation protein Spo0J
MARPKYETLKLRNLRIDEVAIASLKAHPRNPRTHSPKQLRQIADSIRRFGFTNPILIDADDGLIAGHGRIEAAKLLGIATVPTIRLADLSEAEKRAYILADNRLAEIAGWDQELLALEMQAIFRRSWTRMRITNSSRKVAEGTMTISMAAMPSLIAQELRQIGEGRCGRRSMYLDTVD